MANKSVYQDIDADALTYFGLEEDTTYGILSGPRLINKVLVTQDKSTYEKIQRLLTVPTESDKTFINKKKAFILPRCNVSQDRLKAALKEHKITVTNDYELADLIIGHEEIYDNTLRNGESIQSTLMLAKLWNYETTNGSKNGSSVEQLINDSGLETIITLNMTDRVRYYNLSIQDSLYDSWMLTGMALNIAHKIELGEISVVDTETVLHTSANKIELTEDVLDTLNNLINSYDEENTQIAIKLLCAIDYKKNKHLLWTLANEHASWIEYKKDKDLKYWYTASNMSEFKYYSAERMIQYLVENNELSNLYFRYLEPICRKEIHISNRELYVFKVEVKKEYKEYLKKTKNETINS
tara:strand:- start:3916 stop:4977 length:1062 start_codon:yes stop_codon:yes gene_type:complete